MHWYLADNRFEILGLQALATDQRAADLRHRKDLARVRWVYGSAVEDAYLPALGTPVRDETLTNMRVHLPNLLETRRVARSNRP